MAAAWVGRRVTTIERLASTRVAFLTRLGEGMVPDADTVLQDGDLMHVCAPATELDRLERVFAARPPHE